MSTRIASCGVIVNYSVRRMKLNASQNPTPERRVATLDEVARILRISRGSAYAAARCGQIPTIRIGRLLLVPLAALDRLLSGNAELTMSGCADAQTHQCYSACNFDPLKGVISVQN